MFESNNLMNPRFFKDINKLSSYVLKNAESYDLISFDLFDTLVVRRMEDPDRVKLPVAEFAAKLASSAGLQKTADEFQRIREEVELAHRVKNGETNPDREASYKQFMREVVELFFNGATDLIDPAEAFDQILKFELAVEKSVIVPRKVMVELMHKLHDLGKTLIIITDIYLTSDYIAELVCHAGIDKYVSEIISSADTFNAKASGAIFPIIKQRHGIEPAHWLHIGDNYISDGLRAAEHGVHSVIITDDGERHRKSIFAHYAKLAERDHFWRGRLIQQLMLPLEKENLECNDLYRLGYGFLGFLISSFVLRIAERVRELGIKRVFFFSREGLLFFDLWKVIAPLVFEENELPDARYLYVSRRALAAPACAHSGLKHLDAHLSLLPPRNRDIRDVARVFGLEVEGLKPYLAKYGLREDTSLNSSFSDWLPENRTKFDAFLSDPQTQTVIKEQTSEAGRLFEEYLEQELFFEYDKVAVVDMGWLGSIQRFLAGSVAHRPDKPDIHGFVFAASRGIPYPGGPDNILEGCVFDKECFDPAGCLVNCVPDLFEEACRAPHPGTIGYTEKEGITVPVFLDENSSERISEIRQDQHFSELQEGIRDSAVSFVRSVRLMHYSFTDLKPWANHLLVMHLAFPKSSEIKMLRWKHHFDDFDGKHSVPFKTRLLLARLWDMPHWVARIPFARSFFYALHMLKSRC